MAYIKEQASMENSWMPVFGWSDNYPRPKGHGLVIAHS